MSTMGNIACWVLAYLVALMTVVLVLRKAAEHDAGTGYFMAEPYTGEPRRCACLSGLPVMVTIVDVPLCLNCVQKEFMHWCLDHAQQGKRLSESDGCSEPSVAGALK